MPVRMRPQHQPCGLAFDNVRSRTGLACSMVSIWDGDYTAIGQHRDEIGEHRAVASPAIAAQQGPACDIRRQDDLPLEPLLAGVPHQIGELIIGRPFRKADLVDAHEHAGARELDELAHVVRRAHVADHHARQIHSGALEDPHVPRRLIGARRMGDDRRTGRKGGADRGPEQPLGDIVGFAAGGSHLDDAAADAGGADAGLDFRNHDVAQLLDRSVDRNGGERIPVEARRAHDRNAGLLADPPQRHRIAPPTGSAQVGDRRQAEFLGMAKIIDHRLLFRFADAVGRPLLGREIDLQMLMGENPAVDARDVSGHGPDHC